MAARLHRGFVEKTLAALLGAMEHASSSERIAARGGILQRTDARVKLAGCIALVVAAAVARHLDTLAVLLAGVIVLALVSRVPAGVLARLWAVIFAFTAAIALPALFTTPGTAIAHAGRWPVTLQGARSASFLLLRVESAATLALLLVATTPWPHVIAALRSFRVPAVVVVIISMTYRYVFVLLRSAEEMFIARRSRSVGVLEGAARRQMASSAAGVLLGKAMSTADDVYLAMQSRGFRGEVYLLDDFRMRSRDWVVAMLFLVAATAALWQGLR